MLSVDYCHALVNAIYIDLNKSTLSRNEELFFLCTAFLDCEILIFQEHTLSTPSYYSHLIKPRQSSYNHNRTVNSAVTESALKQVQILFCHTQDQATLNIYENTTKEVSRVIFESNNKEIQKMGLEEVERVVAYLLSFCLRGGGVSIANSHWLFSQCQKKWCEEHVNYFMDAFKSIDQSMYDQLMITDKTILQLTFDGVCDAIDHLAPRFSFLHNHHDKKVYDIFGDIVLNFSEQDIVECQKTLLSHSSLEHCDVDMFSKVISQNKSTAWGAILAPSFVLGLGKRQILPITVLQYLKSCFDYQSFSHSELVSQINEQLQSIAQRQMLEAEIIVKDERGGGSESKADDKIVKGRVSKI